MTDVRTAGISMASLKQYLSDASSRSEEYWQCRWEEYRSFTIAMFFGLAIMGLAIWPWDFAIDAARAPGTLLWRLGFVPLGLVPAFILTLTKSRRVAQAVTYADIVCAMLLVATIENQLHNGPIYGLGAYLVMVIAGILLCQGFSAEFATLCIVSGAFVPHILGWISYIPHFDHGIYGWLMWPSVGMVSAALVAMSAGYSRVHDLQRSLEEASTIDPLTNTVNRRAFQPALDHEFAENRRFARPLALIMFDIDEFKHLNDRFGHPAGDQVLKDLAELGRTLVRETDVLARLGGDEFGLMLPGTDLNGAAIVAEKLRVAVEVSQVSLRAAVPVGYTISVGVAALVASDADSGDLIRRADAALYEAKQSGRNRVAAA